jgi:hypothetical protein
METLSVSVLVCYKSFTTEKYSELLESPGGKAM